MKFKKYLVTKGNIDLLSSLKALDEELLKEKLEEFGVDNINELKDEILDDFDFWLDIYKDDKPTKMYFKRLLNQENSEWVAPYEEEMESLVIFIYDNGNHYSYYIPTEIKQIIKKLLGDICYDKTI